MSIHSVHAASVNPLDHKMMKGDLALLFKVFPVVPGFDVSGVVVKAGLYCTRVKPGDSVYGLAAFRKCGAFAGRTLCAVLFCTWLLMGVVHVCQNMWSWRKSKSHSS